MKIFLMAPYSSDDKDIVNDRVRKINKAAADLMKQGHIVFSPISHSHYIAMQEDLPTTFEFWVKQNHAFIEWCDIVYLLPLDGWKESAGINDDEIPFAQHLGKPIHFMVPDEI